MPCLFPSGLLGCWTSNQQAPPCGPKKKWSRQSAVVKTACHGLEEPPCPEPMLEKRKPAFDSLSMCKSSRALPCQRQVSGMLMEESNEPARRAERTRWAPACPNQLPGSQPSSSPSFLPVAQGTLPRPAGLPRILLAQATLGCAPPPRLPSGNLCSPRCSPVRRGWHPLTSVTVEAFLGFGFSWHLEPA